MPQSSSVRVPEEAEEREATKRCKDGVAGVVEHALPLALPYGNALKTPIGIVKTQTVTRYYLSVILG